MEQLSNAKTKYESIDGRPTSRQKFAYAAPPVVRS
jgi:hypothetical protein